MKVWQKLKEIVESVKDHRNTVVPSGHGVGKSWISARIVLWWLFTRFPSKVITTAPTWPQVESILWSEIRGALASAKVQLCSKEDILNTEIKLAPDWFAKGISTTETVEMREYGSTKMQGFHSPNLLVVLDEAPGVPQFILTAIGSLVTGEQNRILKIGNPTSPSGDFFNNCHAENWKKIHISCFDHPNVIEKKEVIPGCVTVQWIEERKEEWGEGSPLWKAKVLGEFPDETEDTLIPLSWCEQAVHAEVVESNITVLGVDPARFGDDKTVGYEIRGNVAKLKFQKTKEETTALSGRLVILEPEYQLIYIDGTGVGGGVIDMAREQLNSAFEVNDRKGYKIIEVHFGGKPTNEVRFVNLRAEMYWHLRERLRPDTREYLKLKIEDDDELKSQLASMKFSYTSNGRIQIESKDEIKKRLGKSPDKADALVLASWASRPQKPETIIENPIYKEFMDYRRKQHGQGSLASRL